MSAHPERGAPLRALVETWRAQAQDAQETAQEAGCGGLLITAAARLGIADTKHACADALSAALDAQEHQNLKTAQHHNLLDAHGPDLTAGERAVRQRERQRCAEIAARYVDVRFGGPVATAAAMIQGAIEADTDDADTSGIGLASA